MRLISSRHVGPMSEKSFSRRHLLCLGTATAAFALVAPGFTPASARDAAASGKPAYPLSGHGDVWEVFKAYDPEQDPDARFFRSSVPRAPRIAPRAATQAHPRLSPDVQGGTLVAAYLALDGGDDLNRMRYATKTPRVVHVERSWQYLDVVVGWNSTGLIPNPALTDAAHRNGALCLGTVFQPDKRMFDGSDLSREAVADKLVKLARYFGFDGYFVNFESFGEPEAREVHDLIEAMKQTAAQQGFSDFYIQYYNGYTDIAAIWPGPPHADGRPRGPAEPRANSMMLDQGWSNYGLTHGCCSGPALAALPSAANTPDFPGIGAVYYGMQLYPGPGYLGLMGPTVVTPNGGPANGSLSIYSVDDGLRKMRNARLNTLQAKDDLSAAERDEVAAFAAPGRRRNAWYGLHQRFWSGQTGNPAMDNAPSVDQLAIYGAANVHKIYTDYETPAVRPTDQMRLPISYGVANFIAERSAIGALPFVTAFNTGEGDRFWKNGVSVSDAGWFNLGCQDVLPTWVWWTRPLNGSDAASLIVDYDYQTAFDGGTSLKITGPAGAPLAGEVRLFKTDVLIESDTEIGLVLNANPAVVGQLSVGLTFAETPDQTQWIAVEHPASGTWSHWTHALAAFAGRRLAVIALGVKAPASVHPYRVNIGQLRLGAAQADRHMPRLQTVSIDAGRVSADGQSAALRLTWRGDDGVYDIVSLHGDGSRQWQGRIHGDAYFIEALERRSAETVTRLQLIAANANGHVGPAAEAIFHWT